MEVIEVKEYSTIKAFHQVGHDIYKDDQNWVPPLEVLEDAAFDPTKNEFYKHGDGTRWILNDDNGKVIGRIGAFINGNRAYTFSQPTGGCGFFECIDDQKAANLLFDTAKAWLATRGMEAMDGPVNFGENLINWGLLVEGFMQQGFGMPYNKPYYLQLFENYGFKIYFEQYSYHLNHKEPFPERFWKIAEWVAKKPNFRFEHVRFDNIEKYIQDFVKIYELAWARFDNHQPVDLDDIRGMMKIAKLVADEEFIWFAYYNDEPVLLFGMIPDLNQILKKLNGKSNWWSILKFIWYKKIRTITRARILIMGVVPKFQGTGLESAVFWHMDKVMQRKLWINEVELSWVGDFNPKMMAIYQSVGGVHAKTHYTMRYLFDRTAPFERAPMLMKDILKKNDREGRNEGEKV
ncbi:MAG TPA: GNAT family N-acetyltransferase [Prolixibacteraceae bacterium]|nr:GNAT family N-acetyltransferase [Prolixibacteraceae bacterium]